MAPPVSVKVEIASKVLVSFPDVSFVAFALIIMDRDTFLSERRLNPVGFRELELTGSSKFRISTPTFMSTTNDMSCGFTRSASNISACRVVGNNGLGMSAISWIA